MKRRHVLRAGVPVGIALFTGCLGDGATPADATASPTPSDAPTDSPSKSPSATPTRNASLSDVSFTVTSNECGQSRNAAGLERADDREVVLAGVIDGSDTCHTARLGDASISEDGVTLSVAVETYVPESTETKACGPCIVEIHYRSTFSFTGGRPDRAVVSHDGERIAEIPFPE